MNISNKRTSRAIWTAVWLTGFLWKGWDGLTKRVYPAALPFSFALAPIPLGLLRRCTRQHERYSIRFNRRKLPLEKSYNQFSFDWTFQSKDLEERESGDGVSLYGRTGCDECVRISSHTSFITWHRFSFVLPFIFSLIKV